MLDNRRGQGWPVSIAPMMDRTDRHYRFFMRQMTAHTLLYSEMITTGAILYGDRSRFLDFSPQERPLVLQLGGDCPRDLADCARIAQDWGYDEINLNVGCPSQRVQTGNFGARLMAQPELVARIVEAMRKAVQLPVTVKHRIGIDRCDRYEDMVHFVLTVSQAGVDRFIVHARKAWLKGLSPKENRSIPPLRYQDVYRLKTEYPQLCIEINGGVDSLKQVAAHLDRVDGVMIGRAAYEKPFIFASTDPVFYRSDRTIVSREEVVERLLPYTERMMAQGVPFSRISRHVLGLFAGQPGAKAWRRVLSQESHKPSAGPATFLRAMEQVPASVTRFRPGREFEPTVSVVGS
ncbi:MAG: tRNA dihydrouridine(20/20a) synthase DusA [Trueperaceae bacterium]|nr:MAG: tRNA dihydrouridine(20/20a) synthase DusA [Trueperaceae bacterium]